MKWSGRPAAIAFHIAAGGLCWTWNRAQSIGIAPAHHQPVASAVSSLRTGSFLDFWKMLSSTTMTCSSSPPRPRPPLLKIGALRPQWPQMYPPNFQRLKLVPSTTRSRHPPPALYRVPGQLTEPSRRQSSCFLQCSPSPCTLPGHSLGHIRVHEPPCQQASDPPRPPLLRNATSGDMWGEGTRYEFLPGPHVSPRHIRYNTAQRSAPPALRG